MLDSISKGVINVGIGEKLVIRNITKFYGNYQALKNIDLVCEAGEFVTILGSSGSGKTTLLKVIAGFEKSSDGKIYINGEDIADKKAYERNIGMLFQNYALFPHMTVEENIGYPLKLRKLPKDEINSKVSKMIKMVKLEGMEKRLPKQLSGGQQQRVALARAIVYNPPLLLLDEPLGALDKNLRHDMQFEIKRITGELGITTISVTHDQEEAFAMSDKICIMGTGKIQQFGSPEQIYEKPTNVFVAKFMGTTNIITIEDMKYKDEGDMVAITGKSNISNNNITLKVEKDKVDYNKTKAVFALRPQSIHLVKDDTEYDNNLILEIKDSVYLGDGVKSKAQFGTKEINITLTVEEYRELIGVKNVNFYFKPEDVSILYE